MVDVKQKDFPMYRGNGFWHRFNLKDGQTPAQPLNWAGVAFAAQIRRGHDDDEFIPFVIDDSGLASGALILTLPGAVTQEMSGAYVWDLEFIDGSGEPQTLLAGNVYVRPDVTRPEP